MATINFTNNADVVYASDYSNVVHTFNLLKGEDTFQGYLAPAIVHGGDGTDIISGGYRNDTLYGDTGWDSIFGDDGSDTMYGGDGNDRIWAIDGYRDVIFGGNGNDGISADGDKVNGNAGNDQIAVGFSEHDGTADITLGAGSDSFNTGGWVYQGGRVDIRDFKAEDHLTFQGEDGDGNPYNHGQALDWLDVNNDGWLGAKDVESVNNDGFSVHVGQNFLELDIQETSIFLHGMTKASFDFLA